MSYFYSYPGCTRISNKEKALDQEFNNALQESKLVQDSISGTAGIRVKIGHNPVHSLSYNNERINLALITG